MSNAKKKGGQSGGTNLYLPKDLVIWAKDYAKTKYGISLSELVERRLTRLKADTEKA